MRRSDSFDFTLDEETEKRLYDLMTDMDTRRTNRFWIKDKRGYHAEYVKIIHCKDCKYWCKGDMLQPIESISYHSCWILNGIGVKGSAALVPSYHYCGWAERKEE